VDVSGYILKGSELSREDVEDLEKRIAVNPEDIDARGFLLGYYMMHQFEDEKSRKAREKHIIWLIENNCESSIVGSPLATLDPIIDGDVFYEAKKLWIKKINDNPRNTYVLSNAAGFMLLYDRDQAEKLLKKLQKIEPDNPEWRKRLGELYLVASRMKASTAKGAENSSKALVELEEAVAMTDKEEDRFYALGDMAMLAFNSGDSQKAADYANELLAMAYRYGDNWNYGNAIHDAHTTLGRVALKNGDVDEAKLQLIESGKTPGSPQLDSFGPSMDLARELIAKGETDAVIKYLELCKKFWEDDYGALDNWIREIKATGTTSFRN